MKVIFSFISVLLMLSAVGQTEITSTFNSTHSGRNVTFAISKTYNNTHEFGGGLRFNINSLAMSDDQNHVYYKRLYASNFMQHLGIAGFYHYHIFRDWEHVKPFLFYDLQATYSTTRNKIVLDATTDQYVRHGPFIWLEQTIGIGFKADLPNGFFITQKLGIGTTFILGNDKQLLKNNFDWEFAGLINVGFGYRFNK